MQPDPLLTYLGLSMLGFSNLLPGVSMELFFIGQAKTFYLKKGCVFLNNTRDPGNKYCLLWKMLGREGKVPKVVLC